MIELSLVETMVEYYLYIEQLLFEILFYEILME